MVRRILISSTPTQLRIAITEDGRLAELFTESPDVASHVGNIYLGKVSKVIQGMNAAFVDIGLEQDAFLHFSDVDSTMEDVASDDDEDDDRPVTDAVESVDVALRTSKISGKRRMPTFHTQRSGNIKINLQAKQSVIVQVTREAYHAKGVRVTTKVGLAGRNVVLLPFDEAVGVSRKVQSVRERKRLRTLAKSILPPDMGCIIRTAAAGLSDEEVKMDFQDLLDRWLEMEKEVKTAKGPMLLHKEAGIAHSVIRDLFKDDVTQVVVDDRKLYREIKNYIQRTARHLDGKVELYVESRPMLDAFGVEGEVHKTHQRRVPLPSGGSIVIDQTEAMVVVDVNSGRASNERSQEGNAVKTNFEAVKEVAQQLRLRDIGGMIMIDFIDMQQEENRRRLLTEIRRELQRDRAKTVVYPLSQLGVLPMTRQRIRQNISERTSEDCPMCFGTGKVQQPSTTVDAITRWLRNYRAQTWGLRVTVAAHPYVVHYIERHKSQTLRKWLRQYFVIVNLREDDSLEAGEFRAFKGTSTDDLTRRYM